MTQSIPVDIGWYQTKGGPASLKVDACLPTMIIGKTRTGKSSVMLREFSGVVRKGHGCLLQDPHGPLADGALHYIPKDRLKDVVLIDPTSHRVPGVGFFNSSKKTLSVEWFLNIIELHSGKFWGPQTAEILTAIAIAVLEHYKKPTIIHIYKALARPSFCGTLLSRSKNQIVKDFYQKWFVDIPKKERIQAFTHPLNKVIVFLRDGIQEVVCQSDPLNWQELIDQKKIVIVRLPKGEIGETATRIIGSLIIFNILLAASQRNTTDHFTLFIDEIHNFLDAIPFELMLAELAKWNITPFFATQTLQQMRDEERRIFNDRVAIGNASNILAFRTSGDDAQVIAKAAGYEDQASAIVRLENYSFAALTLFERVPIWNLPVFSYSKIPKRDILPYEQVLAWATENTGTLQSVVRRHIRAEMKT